MTVVSDSLIEQVWQEIDALEEEEAVRLIESMGEEQPFLLAYLFAIGDNELDEDEKSFLLYMGILIWQCFKRLHPHLPPISQQAFENTQETNIQMLEYLETESEAYFYEFVQMLMQDFPQPALLQFLTESIFEDEDIRDKNKGMLLIYLKVVIECFQQLVS